MLAVLIAVRNCGAATLPCVEVTESPLVLSRVSTSMTAAAAPGAASVGPENAIERPDADSDGEVPVPSWSTAGAKTGSHVNPLWPSSHVGSTERISGCASAGAGAPLGETGCVDAHATRDPSPEIATSVMSPAKRYTNGSWPVPTATAVATWIRGQLSAITTGPSPHERIAIAAMSVPLASTAASRIAAAPRLFCSDSGVRVSKGARYSASAGAPLAKLPARP